MPKLDDDDDEYGDEKSAYEANSKSMRGANNGKRSEEEDEEKLSPVLRAFCHAVCSANFRKELRMFYEAYSDGFENADIEGEQRLEWTALHEKFVALVEKQLETFCGIQQLAPETIFGMVQRACRSGMLDDEFLPSILAITDYAFFIEQMAITACEDVDTARAEKVGVATNEMKENGDHAVSDDRNMSGVWRLATKDNTLGQLTDTKKGLDKYLRAVGVPKSLHGLFRGTLFSAKGLVIIDDRDRDRFTCISDTITGRHKQPFRLDNRKHDLRNPAGTHTTWTATLDRNGLAVVLRNHQPSGLPRGTSIVHTWERLSANLLKCTSEVERPAGGVVMHEFFYTRRQTSTSTPSSRRKQHK